MTLNELIEKLMAYRNSDYTIPDMDVRTRINDYEDYTSVRDILEVVYDSNHNCLIIDLKVL